MKSCTRVQQWYVRLDVLGTIQFTILNLLSTIPTAKLLISCFRRILHYTYIYTSHTVIATRRLEL